MTLPDDHPYAADHEGEAACAHDVERTHRGREQPEVIDDRRCDELRGDGDDDRARETEAWGGVADATDNEEAERAGRPGIPRNLANIFQRWPSSQPPARGDHAADAV